jgi:NAD(P)-dependent dehydrogenase (short-subunit alcohol dehydrogenase family)
MTETGRMSGKICVVTGANSGIGKETALGLAQMGAHVVMVCRNADKGKAALEDVRRDSGNSQVDLLIADMSSQASVRELAKQVHDKYPRLDVLINNAGGGAGAGQLSADGIELTLATNHLGAALLTFLVLDLLKAGAPSRIVNVSSEAHGSAKRLEMSRVQTVEPGIMGGLAMYGRSKLLMNAFTFALAQRLEGTGVTCNCLHPGVVATNIFNDSRGAFKVIVALMRPFMLDSKKGAAVSLWAATSPDLLHVSGKYFVKSKEKESSALSRDPRLIAEVWQWTEKMIGQPLVGRGVPRVGEGT